MLGSEELGGEKFRGLRRTFDGCPVVDKTYVVGRMWAGLWALMGLFEGIAAGAVLS